MKPAVLTRHIFLNLFTQNVQLRKCEETNSSNIIFHYNVNRGGWGGGVGGAREILFLCHERVNCKI